MHDLKLKRTRSNLTLYKSYDIDAVRTVARTIAAMTGVSGHH